MLLLAFLLLAPHQIDSSSPATRAGFEKWAATAHGRSILQFLAENHCQVTVIEDPSERGIGRAPEPGIATLLAAYHNEPRQYMVILNPARNTADAMAVAWAGEMLHIYFYAQGISLPHHNRADFQEEWHAMAAELGMPTLTHDDEDAFGGHPVVRYVGYGR